MKEFKSLAEAEEVAKGMKGWNVRVVSRIDPFSGEKYWIIVCNGGKYLMASGFVL